MHGKDRQGDRRTEVRVRGTSEIQTADFQPEEDARAMAEVSYGDRREYAGNSSGTDGQSGNKEGSDAQLLGYDDFWDAVRVEKTIVSDAERKGMAQGIEKGMAQGMAQGIEKGIAQAEVKWRTEEKKDIARNLKSLGLTTEQIQAATGLTAEEIEGL